MSKEKITLTPESYPCDKLEIEVKRAYIWFHIYCDNAGFSVKISKDKLKEISS